MSVQALSWVFDSSESRLAARHVLLSIANHAKADGTGAWPSIARIAFESKISEREVQRSLRDLVRIGELEIRVGEGPHGTNLYTIVGMTNCHPPTKDPRQLVAPGVTFGPKMPILKSPEPSLLQPSINRIALINLAISESERTGVPADTILKKLREQAV